jgi:hypothetical protein
MPPGTGFHFCPLLQLQPPSMQGASTDSATSPLYITPARIAQKTSLPVLHVFSLPGKQRVHRVVSQQQLFYCHMFTQLLLAMCLHVTVLFSIMCMGFLCKTNRNSVYSLRVNTHHT